MQRLLISHDILLTWYKYMENSQQMKQISAMSTEVKAGSSNGSPQSIISRGRYMRDRTWSCSTSAHPDTRRRGNRIPRTSGSRWGGCSGLVLLVAQRERQYDHTTLVTGHLKVPVIPV